MGALARLPRSLSQLRVAVQKSGSGAAIALGRRASTWQQAQGTRATNTQGTASAGNTPDPLHPGQSVTPGRPPGWDDFTEQPPGAVFSTLAPEYPNTEHSLIQTRDWPPNPSHNIENPNIGHHEQLRTDNALHTGEGPGRIARFMPMRIWGVVIAGAQDRGSEGDTFPSWDYIAHIPVARQALGVKGPQKLSDDNAVIPGVYAGNPRP